MRFVLAMVLAGLVALPLSASGQAGEADTTPEPNLEEPAPSAEPAPEEPALQLQLDKSGVEVVPSPPRTPDGYMLEEMEVRVKRAKIGLWSTAGVTVVGGVIWGASVPCTKGKTGEDSCLGAFAAGAVVAFSGAVGMIVTGALLGARKRRLRSLQEADYGRPHRVQWDLARSQEEMDVRVRRAKIGLGSSAAALFAGGMFVGVGIGESYGHADTAPKRYTAYLWTGTALLVGGFAGMVASGILLGRRKFDRDWLRQAHYATPRRVQWDLAQSRLVF
jgi:hypothetical protein